MKKLLVFLLLSTTLSAVFFSCKKYEDGPMISFIPAKKRAAGDWNFESVTQTQTGTSNTTDITSTYTGAKFNVQEENTGSYNMTGQPNQPFTWQFDDKKEHFIYVINGVTYTAKILRLKNKEFWLEIQDFPQVGYTYEYHLAQ